ncbi:hypothetical protein GJ744_002434 [Endocarpon pusillum]|uniref:Prefoldin subunit 2 n=1 Tax=Endocarpon pusillum TaxID=364733 RepID=A0A8H7AAW5_9EURO|nr:hypothetical protein GJ744_002434 [Endocarpon pusillum]
MTKLDSPTTYFTQVRSTTTLMLEGYICDRQLASPLSPYLSACAGVYQLRLLEMASKQVSVQKQQELQTQYTNYKNTLQSLAQKAGDIEQEIEEHKLVIETLQPLPDDRKCFRMINGVLVERTVKDVLPNLKTNSDGLKQVLDKLLMEYKSKQDEMDSWKKKNNVQVVQNQ